MKIDKVLSILIVCLLMVMTSAATALALPSIIRKPVSTTFDFDSLSVAITDFSFNDFNATRNIFNKLNVTVRNDGTVPMNIKVSLKLYETGWIMGASGSVIITNVAGSGGLGYGIIALTWEGTASLAGVFKGELWCEQV